MKWDELEDLEGYLGEKFIVKLCKKQEISRYDDEIVREI